MDTIEGHWHSLAYHEITEIEELASLVISLLCPCVVFTPYRE